jgi:hypothetical protein
VCGETRLNGFWKTSKSVHTGDEDIFDAAVLQFGEDGEPEFGPFALGHPHAQSFFLPLQINTQRQIKRSTLARAGSHAP